MKTERKILRTFIILMATKKNYWHFKLSLARDERHTMQNVLRRLQPADVFQKVFAFPQCHQHTVKHHRTSFLGEL